MSVKTKILLFELLLKQNKMKNQIVLYEYIIQIEKNYLLDIFKIENFCMSNFDSYKRLMISASESLYKKIK